jgi:hypothetical protein
VGRGAKWWVAGACAVVGVIAAALFLGGEGGLEALRSDPMATYQLPSAVTTRSSQIAGTADFIEDTPAMITRRFTVPPGEGEAAMAEIAAAAEDEGWDVSKSEFGGYSGDKKIDGIRAQISIRGIVSDDIVWFDLYTRD